MAKLSRLFFRTISIRSLKALLPTLWVASVASCSSAASKPSESTVGGNAPASSGSVDPNQPAGDKSQPSRGQPGFPVTVGVEGMVTLEGGGIRSWAIDPDGKLIANGARRIDPETGTVDHLVAFGGQVTEGPRKGIDMAPFGAGFQRNGRMVIGGEGIIPTHMPNAHAAFAVQRVDGSGKLDSSFGIGGMSGELQFSTAPEAADFVLFADDTSAVVGPANSNVTRNLLFVARFDANGAVVAASEVDVGGRLDVRRAVAHGDGGLLIGGRIDGFPTVLRLDSNNQLDPSFGTGGRLRLADRARGVVQDVAVQPDGKIVALASQPAYVLRLKANGEVDTSFGDQGTARSPAGGDADSWDDADGLALQADGKIVVAVTNGKKSNSEAVFVRFTSSGSLDDSFGEGGKSSPFKQSAAGPVVVAPNGMLIAAGRHWKAPTSLEYALFAVWQ